MERQTITQQEISDMTGIAQGYISEALHNVKTATRDKRLKQYDPTEALEAVLAFCERKKQAVADAAARKIAKWDNTIDDIKKRLEV